MKLLLVHPGADTSVSDVYDGLVPALRRQGVAVHEYRLAARLARAGAWLHFNYRRARKMAPDLPRPTIADTVYLAGERVLPIALAEQVDWVLIVSGMYIIRQWLTLLRRAGLRVALLLTESPYAPEEAAWAAEAAVVWTNERTSVPVLRQVCPHTSYLPHAYDPAKHRPDVPDDDEALPAHDVVFVGSAFRERVELLSSVDWPGLVPGGVDLGLYGNWHSLGSRHHLRRYVRGGPIDNRQAAALYRRAKIGLNLYRVSIGVASNAPNAPRVLHAESLNPRALELAACGAFSLSEYRREVREVFGGAVPTFTTPAELAGLLRCYLAHPAERGAKAARLPGLVAGRTFDAMAGQVVRELAAYRCRGEQRRCLPLAAVQEAAG